MIYIGWPTCVFFSFVSWWHPVILIKWHFIFSCWRLDLRLATWASNLSILRIMRIVLGRQQKLGWAAAFGFIAHKLCYTDMPAISCMSQWRKQIMTAIVLDQCIKIGGGGMWPVLGLLAWGSRFGCFPLGGCFCLFVGMSCPCREHVGSSNWLGTQAWFRQKLQAPAALLTFTLYGLLYTLT